MEFFYTLYVFEITLYTIDILVLPLVTLEDQVEGEMARLGLPYVNVTSTPLEALEEQIQNTQPYVLLSGQCGVFEQC